MGREEEGKKEEGRKEGRKEEAKGEMREGMSNGWLVCDLCCPRRKERRCCAMPKALCHNINAQGRLNNGG